ncbi:hypothetical protein EJ06DRAFT_528803 [Trichodelitschia bisporula]|uniref:Uncharacterized protein n=1 Tax=Trichodelitschia bisporula TaxID=703511 RepID=A0A6G1I014_9PEZI|nr:hypothetical protein EJ06DRAFT_528803 [Trichodelitschia bisporula]
MAPAEVHIAHFMASAVSACSIIITSLPSLSMSLGHIGGRDSGPRRCPMSWELRSSRNGTGSRVLLHLFPSDDVRRDIGRLGLTDSDPVFLVLLTRPTIHETESLVFPPKC